MICFSFQICRAGGVLMLKSFFIRQNFSLRSISMNILNRYDPQQVALLYEPLIVVDESDRILGEATKKDAHLLENIEKKPPMIHRAFSFFLFDHSTKPSRLVLQQRSREKITYPSLWANTCCSHPLNNAVEVQGISGVKNAVHRRVQYELGYDCQLNLTFRTKIFYQARNIPDDGIFGESEVDYIIFAHHRGPTPLDLLTDFKVNKNEVQRIESMTFEQCQELVKQDLATPWFSRLVQQGLLQKWWIDIDRDDLSEADGKADTVIQL